LYDLGPGLPKRKPVRTLKVGLPQWVKPAGMAYGPGGTISAYFELQGNGVLYHFQTNNSNPVHTHTFRGGRALLPPNAAQFKGRPLEFVSANEWLVFGRHLIDVQTGTTLGELGVHDPRAQRVVDKDTILLQTADAAGGEQLMKVDLKANELVAKRNAVRGNKPIK
jgi:hypothetical protein